VSKSPVSAFTQPLTVLKGIGPSLAQTFSKLNIHTIQDLLFHLPLRYEDRTTLTPIGVLTPHVPALIQGQIIQSQIVLGRRRSLLCRIQDNTGSMCLRFYHFTLAQKNLLAPGVTLRCFGEIRLGSSGPEMYHPDYEIVQQANTALPVTLTPIYPATEGITQQRMQKVIRLALTQLKLDSVNDPLPDYLPRSLCQSYQLPTLKTALEYLHQPPPNARLQAISAKQHPCQLRLAFEELVAHSLSSLRVRQQLRLHPAPRLAPAYALTTEFLAQLNFKLTSAQQRVWQEIALDLDQTQPMLRLLQGDVGSGKTVIAGLVAVCAIANGYQAAIMAPTEILAEQHYLTFMSWLAPLQIKIGWLSGKTKGKLRQQTLAALANGEIQLLIGTHALFQDDVAFARLGAIIIDEQHRFGVHQRLALKQKSDSYALSCHQLIMTATPIPRSLAMCAYGELDSSVIDELPPGRTPVKTLVLPDTRRNDVIDRIRHACRDKKQIYWVCTLIEESEQLQCQAAENSAEELKQTIPDARIGLLHGRLGNQEKTAIMAQFKAGLIDILVATTVIEVGVNVPNASLMIIENPERLGLAQLHQLRGRVGRGAIESFCLLLYHPPLSLQGQARLAILRESNDGFAIAEHDLALRGPGEVLGTRQTGELRFKIADLQHHNQLVEQAHHAAQTLFQNTESGIIDALIERWLPQGVLYAQV